MAEGRTKWPPVKDDWFVEPAAATQFLLRYEYFTGGIWDPACGQGNIVEACLLDGKDAVGTDIEQRVMPRPAWFRGLMDFLSYKGRVGSIEGPVEFVALRPNIITNAPYGRAKLCEAFIRKAVTMPGVSKVAFFVNAKFLWGGGRAAGLFCDHPPDRIYPVFPRPSCPPGEFLLAGGKAERGVENFAWLVWDLAAPTGRTEFIWGGRGGAPSPRRDAPADDTVMSGLERRLPPRTGPRPRRKS